MIRIYVDWDDGTKLWTVQNRRKAAIGFGTTLKSAIRAYRRDRNR